MSQYIKVEGNNSLVRDKKTGALININTNEFNRSKAIRQKMLNKDKEFKMLKDEVGEIKSLLQQLLEKK